MDYYTWGDLRIKCQKIKQLINNIPKGEYTTSQILQKYQGVLYQNNKNISPGNSWNAYFGKILKRFEKDTNGKYIKEKLSVQRNCDEHGRSTSGSVWEIF